MRPGILVLSTYYHPIVGGSETHARQIARHVLDQGFRVSVLTKMVPEAASREEVVEGIVVRRVGPGGHRSAWQKWGMLPAVFATMLRHRREFDLVYCPDYRGIGVAGILAANLLRRRTVMSTAALGVVSVSNADPVLARFHLSPSGLPARLLKWPLRRIYTAVDAYAAITRAIEREAVDAGISAERVHYLPNSVDTNRFRPARPGEVESLRQELGWPQDRMVVLFLARLSREKGLMDLLEAWAAVPHDRAHLVVAGPDMPGNPFDVGAEGRAWVRDRGLDARVRFVGATSTPERLLRAADLVVQPSHWEAAPFGVVEAMASGCAVVATPVGGMGEYLVDGDNALLTPARDPQALARTIDRALADEGLRRGLGLQARATVEREFDQATVLARYVTLFRSLIDSGRDRSRR